MGQYPFKQEELMLYVYFLNMWAFVSCLSFSIDFYKFSLIISLFIILIMVFFLIKHNKSTYVFYKLQMTETVMVKAKIVWENVHYSNNYLLFVPIRLKMNDTGKLYEWKGWYSFSRADRWAYGQEIISFFMKLPEIYVLQDKNNPDRFYPILEPLMNMWVYKNQKQIHIINCILIAICLIMHIVILVSILKNDSIIYNLFCVILY